MTNTLKYGKALIYDITTNNLINMHAQKNITKLHFQQLLPSQDQLYSLWHFL